MVASTTPSTAIHEREAFCPGCPEPGEVTAFLDTLGFTLGFTMGAVPAHDRAVAPLPAQFHYERDDGLCIIYLAGHDSPMSGEHFPAHQSRFWAYAGAESAAFDRITRALAVKWGFTWQRAAQDGQRPAQRAHVGKPRSCSGARATDLGRHQTRGSEPGNLVRRERGAVWMEKYDGVCGWFQQSLAGRQAAWTWLEQTRQAIEQRDQFRSFDPPPRRRMFLRWLWRR